MHIFSLSNRNGILVLNWNEALFLNSYLPSFKHKPFIITDSKIFDINRILKQMDNLIEEGEIASKTKFSDCSCFKYFQNNTVNKEICKEFVETHLFTGHSKYAYHFWNKWETKAFILGKYKKCTHRIVELFDNIKQVNNIYLTENLDYIDKKLNNNISLNNLHSITISNKDTYQYNNYNKISISSIKNALYSSRYISFYLDQSSKNEIIHKNNYENIFNSLNDIVSLRIWYGIEKYKSTRHFDEYDNIYLIMKGSKKFILSPTTALDLNYYIFQHESDRHEYPNYPILETYHNISINGYDDENNNYFNKYQHKINVYQDELLYIPDHWNHETINNQFSISINIWFNGLKHEWNKIIRPRYTVQSISDLNEFIYYFGAYPIRWCDKLKQYNLYYEFSKCNKYKQYDFMFEFISKMYPILNDIQYQYDRNNVYIKYILDLEGISTNYLITSNNKIFKSLYEFFRNAYFCQNLSEFVKNKWDLYIEQRLTESMKLLMDENNTFDKHKIGILELQWIKQSQYWLLNMLADESQLIPLLITMHRL